MQNEPIVRLPPELSQRASLSSRVPTGQGRLTLQRRMLGFGILAFLLVVGFASPLAGLARFAFHSDLYSHILLIPFISLYLIWVSRQSLAPDEKLGWMGMAGPLFAGFAILLIYKLAALGGWQPEKEDYLAFMTAEFLCLLLAGMLLFLGRGFVRRYLFALALLLFTIPFPAILCEWIEVFFQHGSTETSYGFLWASGVPILREGFVFHMPGSSIQVARECSGIHSSLVLFITSLLAGHLFLRRASSRWLLTLAVIPLALLRNGLRIFVIAQLCVQIDPSMIHSFIHKRGGPIFFALSLIPFFLLILFLRRREAHSESRRKEINQLESVI